MGATTSAAPPGRASIRAGTRIDSRSACSVTTAVPKSRLHCCSFRKLMPARPLLRRAWRRVPLRRSGCTSTSPTRCSSFKPLATAARSRARACRRAPASRRRRRCPGRDGPSTRRLRAGRCRRELHLDVALGQRLECVEAREVDREPRRLADDERRILREQLRLVGPPRHAERLRASPGAAAGGARRTTARRRRRTPMSSDRAEMIFTATTSLLLRVRGRSAPGARRAACRWRESAPATRCGPRRAIRECPTSPSR